MYKRDELKALKKEFWIEFAHYCDSLSKEGKHKSFILYNTKIKGIELKFDATREGAFVILEINLSNTETRLEKFQQLQACRSFFATEFPDNLIWEADFTRSCGTKVSSIYIQQADIDIHRRDQWPLFHQFLATNMVKMERVFFEIRDIIA